MIFWIKNQKILVLKTTEKTNMLSNQKTFKSFPQNQFLIFEDFEIDEWVCEVIVHLAHVRASFR